MSELDDLYQDIILDHNKRPRNFKKLEPCTHFSEGHNPLCGDQMTVYLTVDAGIIQDISFQGQGCAISKASASLMTVYTKGKKLEEVYATITHVCGLLTQEDEPSAQILEQMGDIAALSGVRKFHARIKCASLAWHALKNALDIRQQTTTE